MASNNARLIEKDILSNILSTQDGDSEIVNLNGASKFSCQAIYDVQSPAAQNFTDTDVDITENVINIAAHGFSTGYKVQLTTDATLPDPLVVLTDYFIIAVDENSIKLASSLSNALAGTAIILTDEGSVGAANTITGVALAGASLTFQKSNDGINFIDIQAATSISADGSVMIEQSNVSYKYFKIKKALTSGQVNLKALVLVIGDSM